ncbi:hypothetical protein [Enterocloster clostridioformis]|uniref:hypothetical protein n=1 Tax=Enterocloster clostridioformis TaxID=1531 RepID=UPI0022E700D6|nr:hypothetical protein [Enterocloster clostridioformis]
MNLQKKLDLIEAYRNSIKFLSHSNRGIEYTVIPDSKTKPDPVKLEVDYGREERTQR